jgi:plastocyanin
MLAVTGIGVGFILVVLYVLYGFQNHLEPGRQSSVSPGAGLFEKTKFIEVTDRGFEPKSGTVKFGDKVTWKNTGTRTHNVTFRFLSKTLYPGEEWSWTVGRDVFSPGKNPYACDLHPGDGNDGGSLIVEG